MSYKSLRFALVAGILFLVTQASYAQDKIYLQDGTIIEAKVKEISARSIVYRRWDNQEGADYILTRHEVNRIVYQNGAEEKLVVRTERRAPFSRNEPDRQERRPAAARVRVMDPGYGRNIIAVAPLQMTNATDASLVGVGVSYERFIDKAGIFSLYLPVAVSFFDDPLTPAGEKIARSFIYAYPGAKIYPAGSGRRASYSVGPSFALGFGTMYKQTRTVDPTTGSIRLNYNEASVFKAGFMVNNGVNIQPTKKLYVGVEFGVGVLYYNNEHSDYIVGDEAIIQFNFKMGYRF